MKKLVTGILAHVDAGKTTLSEALLFSSGTIDKLGRVDKRDSFLDTHTIERERGITVFSKQAVINYKDTSITLVDTPGHVDFSAEAERALAIQDYAILVISAQDGVQAHTKTLWQLLKNKGVPTFIFVNKTDIGERGRLEIVTELRRELSGSIADFSTESVKMEDIAGADEELMREYFDTGTVLDSSIAVAIRERRLFPALFGSALKMTGIKEFLEAFDTYTLPKRYPEKLFGAKIYKIGRDRSGARLTYLKVTGGTLAAKDIIRVKTREGDAFPEKVEEIRIYSGDKYKSVREVAPGDLCAILGPTKTEVGGGLGFEQNDDFTLTPVLDYKMILPEDVSVYEAYLRLTALSEEDPSLAISYNERAKEIRVRLMGDIQTEVLKRIISDRFGMDVSFSEGAILYKETILEPTRGAGHFEPLRHYSEVHLLIEPMPEGTGIISDTDCSQDVLATNWQRLVMTHIEERIHKGVLTGSPLTDVKITLTSGRAHQKHTEGGDFRQATYRAIRQGLMKAKSVLLEPTFDFRIDLPRESFGRAMTDIEEMGGTIIETDISESTATLTGNCPVSTMRSYATRLRAFTRGEGKISMRSGGYKPCRNPEEVITAIGYDPMLDERNTPNSVFCKNGSGYVVPWNEADELMHCSPDGGSEEAILERVAYRPKASGYRGTADEDKELMRIFEATYGKIKERRVAERVENSAPEEKEKRKKAPKPKGDTYIVIDGYNLIFAWDFLKRYAESDLSLARDILTRIACNYAHFYKCRIVIVFDAYKRQGGEGSTENFGNVTVVYTKQSETADAYIERCAKELAEKNAVRVVTNDYIEQLMVLGVGALRVPAKEFAEELGKLSDDIDEIIKSIK